MFGSGLKRQHRLRSNWSKSALETTWLEERITISFLFQIQNISKFCLTDNGYIRGAVKKLSLDSR